MQNSIYYTFSSISQVLASFLALSGFFMMFRLQEIKKLELLQIGYFLDILNSVTGLYIGSFHNCPHFATNLKTFYLAESVGGTEIEMKKILLDEHVINGFQHTQLKTILETFKRIDKKRKWLLTWTLGSIIFGLLTILYSLTILSRVHMIIGETTRLYLFGFGGTIACLLSMCLVIVQTFTNSNMLTKEINSTYL